jgi:hypothetical protein
MEQIRSALTEATGLGTVTSVYFEGGEPFLFHPLMVAAVREARTRGFQVGIVTNAYWATTVEDAQIWLATLVELGISDLSISDDAFHQDSDNNTAKNARKAAEALGIPVGSICIDPPTVVAAEASEGNRGKPIVGGSVLFKGRAADKLVADLPRRPRSTLKTCPHEELVNPERVHVDAFGHVHVCQGISLGNMWQTPLSRLMKKYRAEDHPVVGPLVMGGPDELADVYGIDAGDSFVDECHMCFLVRRALVDRFPEYLAPRQVYGIDK